MKIIYFTKYTRLGASSRLRSYQYFPYLKEKGFEVEVYPLFNDTYLNQLYSGKVSKFLILRLYIKRLLLLFKISRGVHIVIEKEFFPYVPAWIEVLLSFLGVNYIVDYDDAIFHNYDLSQNKLISFFLKNKINVVMRNSGCVIAGNNYLAARAQRAGANKIEIIPTVIDIHRYHQKSDGASAEPFVIGWIGSPSTFKYVQEIALVLKEMASTGCHIHIIGAKGDLGFSENLYFLDWKEEFEAAYIANFSVGIMPLVDSLWEKGKCSYKLIQYMASGIPVVASPVGMNTEVVDHITNGYLVKTKQEWLVALKSYKDHPSFCKNHGRQGRKLVENKYTLQSQLEHLVSIIKNT